MKKVVLVFLTTLCLLTGCSQSTKKEAFSDSISKGNINSILTSNKETDNQEIQNFILSFKDAELTKPLIKADYTEIQTLLASKKINNEVDLYRNNNYRYMWC
jgi:major membrane immunogen (membrane-anchored lipoprotein)